MWCCIWQAHSLISHVGLHHSWVDWRRATAVQAYRFVAVVRLRTADMQARGSSHAQDSGPVRDGRQAQGGRQTHDVQVSQGLSLGGTMAGDMHHWETWGTA